jgi:16S rRNA (uracil1498-N3)-methyltransferase
MEFMVQKCTEIGITSFQPVLMERTNNKKINLERLKLISIEACEQSSRVNLSSFNNLISFSEMIKTISYDKLIFCSLEKNTSTVDKINLSLNETIGIIIGPEGDFSQNEMTDLRSIKNSIPVTLGSNILKSETAGVVAFSLIMNSIYND